MMLRKFGFKKAEPKESEARLKLQKELFAYNRVRVHRAGLGGKQYGRGGGWGVHIAISRYIVMAFTVMRLGIYE